jgi:hypothetical protein
VELRKRYWNTLCERAVIAARRWAGRMRPSNNYTAQRALRRLYLPGFFEARQLSVVIPVHRLSGGGYLVPNGLMDA